jgi:hypothetical protein
LRATRVSTNGGATWTAAMAVSGFMVVNEGETLVQFRSVDSAGLLSASAPAKPVTANAVCIR